MQFEADLIVVKKSKISRRENDETGGDRDSGGCKLTQVGAFTTGNSYVNFSQIFKPFYVFHLCTSLPRGWDPGQCGLLKPGNRRCNCRTESYPYSRREG